MFIDQLSLADLLGTSEPEKGPDQLVRNGELCCDLLYYSINGPEGTVCAVRLGTALYDVRKLQESLVEVWNIGLQY